MGRPSYGSVAPGCAGQKKNKGGTWPNLGRWIGQGDRGLTLIFLAGTLDEQRGSGTSAPVVVRRRGGGQRTQKAKGSRGRGAALREVAGVDVEVRGGRRRASVQLAVLG